MIRSARKDGRHKRQPPGLEDQQPARGSAVAHEGQGTHLWDRSRDSQFQGTRNGGHTEQGQLPSHRAHGCQSETQSWAIRERQAAPFQDHSLAACWESFQYHYASPPSMNARLFLHPLLPCPVERTQKPVPLKGVPRHRRISGTPLRGLLIFSSFFSRSRCPFTKLGRFSYEIKGKGRALLPTRKYGCCFPRPTYLHLQLAQVPYSSLHPGHRTTYMHTHTCTDPFLHGGYLMARGSENSS